jgi:hypothetical protein
MLPTLLEDGCEKLDEDEACVWTLKSLCECEGGLCVRDVVGNGVPGFTDYGIECLEQIPRRRRSRRRGATQSKETKRRRDEISAAAINGCWRDSWSNLCVFGRSDWLRADKRGPRLEGCVIGSISASGLCLHTRGSTGTGL